MFEQKDFDKDTIRTPQYIFDWLDSKYKFNVDLAASDEHHFTDLYFAKEDDAIGDYWGWGMRDWILQSPIL